MNILIDIGHPAHVHFYRNFIKKLDTQHHQIYVVARDKEVAIQLLENYHIEYINRGKGGNSGFEKIFYLLKIALKLIFIIRQNNIDILTGIGNPYISIAAFITGKKSIVFNDTEHAKATVSIIRNFASVLLTPASYKTFEGKKHLTYRGFHELAYLHPNQYTPDITTLDMLGIKRHEKYVIIRFVSWEATHDIGYKGINLEAKERLVTELSKFAKVIITSEGELTEFLRPYQLKVSPEKIHDLLAFAALYIGEGATMASECAMLGTPAIYVNPLTGGTVEEQEKYGLLYGFRNSNGVIEKALELLNTGNIEDIYQKRRLRMLSEKIDVTEFMAWFIENFPDSRNIMRSMPEYQNRFIGVLTETP